MTLCMATILLFCISSFTAPTSRHYSFVVKNNFDPDEEFVVSAEPGIGAKEIPLIVNRTGTEAGLGNVSFDVDIMYNGIPSQYETHHVYMSNGQTSLWQYRQTCCVIGTDAEPIGEVYNKGYN